MRGFEEKEAKAEATLDDVLASLQTLNDAVLNLVELLSPTKSTETVETKTETTEQVEE